MRLNVVRSKNAASLYMIESTFVGGKHSTRIVEKLGTEMELRKKLGGADPYEWARTYIAQMTQQEREGTRVIKVEFDPRIQIPLDQVRQFNAGYLFLQAIYYGLRLDELCKEIMDNHRFRYDLNAVLSRLIYTRILDPCSKLSSYEQSKHLLEPVSFALEDVYRALDVLAEESDRIQAHVYQSSKALSERNTAILYYDCTNYYFEIEQEDGFRQFGVSKEHRPNPIVQMGLFMDGNGIPLGFSIYPGAMNEQPTLKPLEQRILDDFPLSKCIVCTDAGLGSMENRAFNDVKDRAFVVTQSLKTLETSLLEWALCPEGWKLPGGEALLNLTQIQDTAENLNTYYKERRIRSEVSGIGGKKTILEQKLIVSYSPKYKAYQRQVRSRQIERAQKMINNPSKRSQKKQNDPARFIAQEHCTKDGEIARRCVASLDTTSISKEEKFDGFYGVCTNLDEDIATIIKINQGRWEIEESFRILKTEFRARPVYLSCERRIKAHFLTCFLSLLIYRILERSLNQKFTSSNIVQTLRDMQLHALDEDYGFLPSYTRTALTDALHDAFGFSTDQQILTKKKLAVILRQTMNTRTLLKK